MIWGERAQQTTRTNCFSWTTRKRWRKKREKKLWISTLFYVRSCNKKKEWVLKDILMLHRVCFRAPQKPDESSHCVCFCVCSPFLSVLLQSLHLACLMTIKSKHTSERAPKEWAQPEIFLEGSNNSLLAALSVGLECSVFVFFFFA